MPIRRGVLDYHLAFPSTFPYWTHWVQEYQSLKGLYLILVKLVSVNLMLRVEVGYTRFIAKQTFAMAGGYAVARTQFVRMTLYSVRCSGVVPVLCLLCISSRIYAGSKLGGRSRVHTVQASPNGYWWCTGFSHWQESIQADPVQVV